jgi:hypothetical protein
MKDKNLLADAEKSRIEISPVSREAMQFSRRQAVFHATADYRPRQRSAALQELTNLGQAAVTACKPARKDRRWS